MIGAAHGARPQAGCRQHLYKHPHFSRVPVRDWSWHTGKVMAFENSTATAAAPVSSEERVFALDVIRGVALLGIFIMNMPGFAASFYSGMVGFHEWPTWWDQWTELLRNVLLGGKFNSMFSFLFGVGFTIQLVRLLERDPSRGHLIYVRRLVALLAFGVLHACLLWTGDVLHIYALLGLLLLLLRNASDRTIVLLIVLCVLGPPLLSIGRLVFGMPEGYLSPAVFERWQVSNNAAYGQGTFMDAAREHTREMLFLYTDGGSFGYVVSFYLQMTTTMLIGLLAGRHRWIQNAAQHRSGMMIWQWTMLCLGLISAFIYTYGETRSLGLHKAVWDSFELWFRDVFGVVLWADSSHWAVLTPFAYVVCRLALVTFYVVSLLRLTSSERWQPRLELIATVGRMPLTNYLMQTVIATFIFYGWGLGFWNRGAPTAWLLLAVVPYVLVQIPFSVWWLNRFRYGPLEYLWRLLTYGFGSLSRPRAIAPAGGVEMAASTAADPPLDTAQSGTGELLETPPETQRDGGAGTSPL
jgi:uncharacterized protein